MTHHTGQHQMQSDTQQTQHSNRQMQPSQQMQPAQQMRSGQQMDSGMQLQSGGQQSMAGGGRLPQGHRQALQAVGRAIGVCGWCADQCIQEADPHMIECVRLCEDVVELGETLMAIAPRSSPFTADIVRTFTQAAQACAQECGKHEHDHCQECATVLGQTAQSVQSLQTQGTTTL